MSRCLGFVEVITFGSSITSGLSPVDMGPLGQCEKPTGTNMSFKMDRDFRLDGQISTMVKSSFFQLTLGKGSNLFVKGPL